MEDNTKYGLAMITLGTTIAVTGVALVSAYARIRTLEIEVDLETKIAKMHKRNVKHATDVMTAKQIWSLVNAFDEDIKFDNLTRHIEES